MVGPPDCTIEEGDPHGRQQCQPKGAAQQVVERQAAVLRPAPVFLVRYVPQRHGNEPHAEQQCEEEERHAQPENDVERQILGAAHPAIGTP